MLDTRPPQACADPAQGGGRVLVELSKVEQRYDAVLAVIRDGMTISEVAMAYGVSRQSVHRWLQRYEEGGLAALAERSHRPKSCPHQMPATVEARILELRRSTRLGPIRLRHQLERERVKELPSLLAIYRALVRHHLIEPKAQAQAPAHLQALGTRPADGALADGHRRRGPLRRRHRVQGLDRRRRPFAVLRLRRDHGPGHGPAGVRLLRPGPRAPRGARRDPDRQRQGLHRPLRPHAPPRSSSTRSAGRTASPTA